MIYRKERVSIRDVKGSAVIKEVGRTKNGRFTSEVLLTLKGVKAADLLQPKVLDNFNAKMFNQGGNNQP